MRTSTPISSPRGYMGPKPNEVSSPNRGIRWQMDNRIGPTENEVVVADGFQQTNMRMEPQHGHRNTGLAFNGGHTTLFPAPTTELTRNGWGIRVKNGNTAATPAANVLYILTTSAPLLTSTWDAFTLAMVLQPVPKSTARVHHVLSVNNAVNSSVLRLIYDEATSFFHLELPESFGFIAVFDQITATQADFNTPKPVVVTWSNGVGVTLYFEGKSQFVPWVVPAFATDSVSVLAGSRPLSLKSEAFNGLIVDALISEFAWTQNQAIRWASTPLVGKQRATLYADVPDVTVPSPFSPSNTSIANAALRILGERELASLDDKTKAARLLKERFADVRDALLRAIVWKFARARASLERDIAPPLWGYSRQYTLPADCVRLISVDTAWGWTLEGRKILTDAFAPLDILYSRGITDPTKMDSLFRRVLAATLAVEIAEAMTGEASVLHMALDELSTAWGTAIAVNGQEGSPEPVMDVGAFLTSRGVRFWMRELNIKNVTTE